MRCSFCGNGPVRARRYFRNYSLFVIKTVHWSKKLATEELSTNVICASWNCRHYGTFSEFRLHVLAFLVVRASPRTEACVEAWVSVNTNRVVLWKNHTDNDRDARSGGEQAGRTLVDL
jgi:hypothetical protein